MTRTKAELADLLFEKAGLNKREASDMVDGRVPLMVVDGRESSWAAFGQMLMSLEGWQFRLEIFDPSDEV